MAPAGGVSGIRWGRVLLFSAALAAIAYAHVSGSISLSESVALPGATTAPLWALLAGVAGLYLIYTAGIGRTLTYAAVLALVAGVVVAVAATAGTGIPAVDNTSESLVNSSWGSASTPADSDEPARIQLTDSSVADGRYVVTVGEIDPDATVTPEPDPETPTAFSDSRNSTLIDVQEAERLILQEANAIRADRELSTLSMDEDLREFAQQHSDDMVERDYYSHSGPDGSPWEERARRISQTCPGSVSENIHRGDVNEHTLIYGTDQAVFLNNAERVAVYGVESWMNSAGHRENMVDPRWNTAGVGVAVGAEYVYMTIVFC